MKKDCRNCESYIAYWPGGGGEPHGCFHPQVSAGFISCVVARETTCGTRGRHYSNLQERVQRMLRREALRRKVWLMRRRWHRVWFASLARLRKLRFR